MVFAEDAASTLEALRRLRESVSEWVSSDWKEIVLYALDEEILEHEHVEQTA